MGLSINRKDTTAKDRQLFINIALVNGKPLTEEPGYLTMENVTNDDINVVFESLRQQNPQLQMKPKDKK